MPDQPKLIWTFRINTTSFHANE